MQAQVKGNLLEAAAGEEGGDGVDVNNLAFQRQACGDTHNVCLADSLHEETAGHLRFELFECANPEVGSDEEDPRIPPGQLVNHVQGGLAHYAVTSNSARSDLTSSSVTLFL